MPKFQMPFFSGQSLLSSTTVLNDTQATQPAGPTLQTITATIHYLSVAKPMS